MTEEAREIIAYIKSLSDEELLNMLADNPTHYSPLEWRYANDEFAFRNNVVLAQKLKEKIAKQSNEAAEE